MNKGGEVHLRYYMNCSMTKRLISGFKDRANRILVVIPDSRRYDTMLEDDILDDDLGQRIDYANIDIHDDYLGLILANGTYLCSVDIIKDVSGLEPKDVYDHIIIYVNSGIQSPEEFSKDLVKYIRRCNSFFLYVTGSTKDERTLFKKRLENVMDPLRYNTLSKYKIYHDYMLPKSERMKDNSEIDKHIANCIPVAMREIGLSGVNFDDLDSDFPKELVMIKEFCSIVGIENTTNRDSEFTLVDKLDRFVLFFEKYSDILNLVDGSISPENITFIGLEVMITNMLVGYNELFLVRAGIKNGFISYIIDHVLDEMFYYYIL